MATSPTQLSLAWLKKEGYLAEVVEKWIPGANIRKDLWGWCDIVAIRDEETVAVQCTSWDNISSRCKKIAEIRHSRPSKKGWLEHLGYRLEEERQPLGTQTCRLFLGILFRFVVCYSECASSSEASPPSLTGT
jgi:hypothetical protein